MLEVRILPNDNAHPVGKLADAEVHFTEGILAGLKLVGFGIWQARDGALINVTFPARHYSVNGERRSFVLLRPIENAAAKESLRQLIIDAYTNLFAPANHVS